MSFQWPAEQLQAAVERANELGNAEAAARECGIPARTIRDARIRAQQQDSGNVPVIPEGHRVLGVSTLVDGNGAVTGQWIKTKEEGADRIEQLIEAVEGIALPFKGASKPTRAPTATRSDLLTVYPMGDPHIGMLSWFEETGANFDLEIAEASLVAAVDRLVNLAPPTEEALIINLGDYFHSDNSTNRTLRSGNALDVDSRWPKILRVGIRTMKRCIDRALLRHKMVRVVCEIGNHDDHSAIFLALCLEQLYEREPRVTIDTSPARFHWHRFGKCLIGITHGDNVKPERLPGIMAATQARDWGETEHRYWYTGHVHHDTLKEYPGCTVETFRTLAARDAWHAGAGYVSGRDMKCDVLHRDHGRILRHTVGFNTLEL